VGVLTARVGSIGDNRMGGWHSYRASKAAANQIVRGAAIEIGRKRKEAVVVALHPGTVETPFTAAYSGHRKMTAPEAAARLLDVLEGLTPAQSGGFYDYSGRRGAVVTRLVLVLGDQLTPTVAALRGRPGPRRRGDGRGDGGGDLRPPSPEEDRALLRRDAQVRAGSRPTAGASSTPGSTIRRMQARSRASSFAAPRRRARPRSSRPSPANGG
jgi:hypothetical protein